jgi:hypothetical protein
MHIKHRKGIRYENEVTFHIPDLIHQTDPILKCWIASREFIFTYSSSRKYSDMETFLASGTYERSVFQSSSLQAFWKTQSSFRQILQPQEICKSKEPLWVDDFLEMVINNQEYISVIP